MEDVIRPLGSFSREPVKRGSVSILAPALAVSAFTLYVTVILYSLYILTGNALLIESIAAIGFW